MVPTKRLGVSSRRPPRAPLFMLLLVPSAIPLLSVFIHSIWLNSHDQPAPSDHLANAPVPLNDPLQSPLYADANGSSLLLLREAQRQRPVFDEEINVNVEAKWCKRYGMGYDGRTTRRRVFYGGLIADDSWGTIAMTAIENFGIFHTVAFVESNRTQMRYPRELRFAPNSDNLQLLQGGMFGPETKVTVDHLGREHHQRALILARWKANGMKKDDIGYLADVDEVFSRDFLRAAQICRVKEFDDHGNCADPKLAANAINFEGGPQCLTRRYLPHPDMILGECLEGIGNSSRHARPERTWEGLGWRGDGYSKHSKYSKLPENTTHFPLYNAADMRRLRGENVYGIEKNSPNWYSGYHFHNFFQNVCVLRNKYLTYGHPMKEAIWTNLSNIHGDVKSMVYCSINLTEQQGTQYPWIAGGLSSLEDGLMPLAFKVPGYVDARMEELHEILELDSNLRKYDAARTLRQSGLTLPEKHNYSSFEVKNWLAGAMKKKRKLRFGTDGGSVNPSVSVQGA
ncbi:hypothetical protein ACHAWF_009349 [Thalassiosira exigua]